MPHAAKKGRLTVDKLKVFIAPTIAVVVCAAGVLALWLWPPPKAKEDSRLLTEAVERAGRRYNKALARMTNAALEVGDEVEVVWGGRVEITAGELDSTGTHSCNDLPLVAINTELEQVPDVVRVCGWVQSSREEGGKLFIQLRDRKGHVAELVCPWPSEGTDRVTQDTCRLARRLRNEWVIAVSGKVRRLGEDPENPDVIKIEVRWNSLTVLNALAIITVADEELREKMKAHDQAEDEVKAMAHATAARIASLRAKYFGELAEHAWQRARQACREGYIQQATLGSQVGQLRHHLNLTELSTAEVAAERKAATTDKSDREKDIQTLDAKVKDLEKTRDRLNAENQKRAAEAQKLETASQLAGNPHDKQAKWEASRTIRKAMDKARNEIESNEDQIQLEAARRKDLVVRRNEGEARIAAATLVLEDRSKEKTEYQGAVQTLKKKIEATQKTIATLAALIVKTGTMGVQAREQAVAACGQAANDLTEAAKLYPREKRAAAKAAHADVAMFWGRILANQYDNSTETGYLVTDLQKVWPDASAPGAPKGEMPQVVKNINNVVSQPADIKTAARGRFDEAITLYGEAMNDAPGPHLHWAYEGQVALAHRAVYDLSREPDSLDKGRQALTKAVDGKRASPFLKQYVEELDHWPK